MLRKSASSAGRDLQLTDQVGETIEAREAIETEVRESAVPVDVMTAARSQMRTKQIDERPLPIERRITGKQTLQIPCCPRATEAIGQSETAIVNEKETSTPINYIVADVTIQSVIMIETGEIERKNVKSSTVGEVTLEEASMSCPTVMTDLAVADVVELTVMWRVLEAPE